VSGQATPTTVFAEALERQPRHWPRIDWLRESPSPDVVRFVNGDFIIKVRKTSAGWVFDSATEANRRSRASWWVWAGAGAGCAVVSMALAVLQDERWLWGLGTVLLLAGTRYFFELSYVLRRGGTRIPVPPLYDRDQ
jgi:hypothetical protein